jgi:CRISPR-associated protein Csb2
VVGIEFTFPGGRYHATPWDAHVNEGIVEWPPSPWRIIRSLIATRHLKATDQVPEETLHALVESLSAELPSYALPRGAVGFHTRHYMPLFAEKTTKVFDTFLHLPAGERIIVAWPTTVLDADLRSALACLVERLGYLGRAEAWVEGRLCDASSMELDCRPSADRAVDDDEIDLVRTLAPMPPHEIERWRVAALDERIMRALDEKRRKARKNGKAADKLKLSAKEIAALESALPRSIYEALTAGTDVMRKEGWNRPPGSRWVEYARPQHKRRPVARAVRRTWQFPTVARYALAGEVLPRFTEGVFEAERVRVGLLSHSDGAPVFTGRDPTSGDLLAGHRHAFILPEANGRDGHITHVTLYARMGFDDRARAALERLRGVWQRSGHDLQLVLLGLGEREDFAGVRTEAGQCALLAIADSWVSRTPFVPTRHPKHRGTGEPKIDEHGLIIGSPEHDLIRLLLEQGFPRPVRVERISDTNLGGKPIRWLAFHTRRKKGHGRRASVHGVGFRLVFPSPVRGPIAVGYGAHFGLGCFVPAPSKG